MNLNQKLLKRLPKKYHERFDKIEEEGDLVDDCQYMLYLKKGWNFYGYDAGITFPVRNLTEAVEIIRTGTERD